MSGPGAAALADRLAIDPGGAGAADRFVSRSPADRHHVFGGLLLGQGLRAAAATVDGDRPACSVHASFVARARGGEPLSYDVERTRDGSSFSTRRVVAHQGAGPVLVLTADFQVDEDGAAYQPVAPAVEGPDGLPAGRYDSPWFESRDVPGAAGGPHARLAWFRATAPMPDDPGLHLQALAYLSDHGPTRAARQPHAHLADDGRRQSVSLDHSLWIHRPVAVDAGWLLYELAPVATGRGRGLALGAIWDASGARIATVAQEVLLRSR